MEVAEIVPARRDHLEPFRPLGRPVVFFVGWKKYAEIYHVVDKYTGECRRACTSHSRGTKGECTPFRVPFALAVLQLLGARRWLDLSAGWGDRLFAAILYGRRLQHYVGVDPNPCLHPGYQRMLRELTTDYTRKKKFTLIEAPFETATLPADKTYDLVFTSPPFFDVEVYTDAPGQSIKTFPTLDTWYKGFLLPSLRKALAVLEPRGFLVLYVGADAWVPRMRRWLDAQLTYQGQIYYTDNDGVRHVRGAYVWQKGEVRPRT